MFCKIITPNDKVWNSLVVLVQAFQCDSPSAFQQARHIYIVSDYSHTRNFLIQLFVIFSQTGYL